MTNSVPLGGGNGGTGGLINSSPVGSGGEGGLGGLTNSLPIGGGGGQGLLGSSPSGGGLTNSGGGGSGIGGLTHSAPFGDHSAENGTGTDSVSFAMIDSLFPRTKHSISKPIPITMYDADRIT